MVHDLLRLYIFSIPLKPQYKNNSQFTIIKDIVNYIHVEFKLVPYNFISAFNSSKVMYRKLIHFT